ncbi:retinal pigment epithelial membrane protein-domain-containing protein [Paraphysoderma sedebokerense]|nr:retinal pigment epithelial membrane protein-domain-containing protein [Paraphysoderma sedebokerense]
MNIIPDFPLGRSKGGDHLICLTDASLLQEIDPITLIPKRVFRYSDINPLFQGDGAPAVVQRDEREKETIAYSLSPTKGTYNIFSILDEDHFEPPGHMIASVQAKPTYAHSFALTKNYVIIVVYPFSAGLGSLRLYWARNYRDALRFDHSSPMYFHIIDREKRDQICIFKAPACFALNVVNAWEESDGSICVDLNAYDDDTIVHCFGLRNLRTLGMPPFPPGTVRRYVLSKVPEAAAIYKIRKNEIPEVTTSSPLSPFDSISTDIMYRLGTLIARILASSFPV